MALRTRFVGSGVGLLATRLVELERHAQCEVDRVELVPAQMPDQPAEPSWVNRRGLFDEHLGGHPANRDGRPEAPRTC